MRIVIGAALVLALAGCSGGEKKRHAPEPSPTSVPASYQVFPTEVRADIYHWDLLNQKCSGRLRPKDEALCEEKDKLRAALLAKGWCFGGADEPANAHWVLCAEDYPGAASWIASPIEEKAQ